MLLSVVVAGSMGTKQFATQILEGFWSQRDNLAFLLFLLLGLSAWQRRGLFWGCLILVPIGLAAMSGTPLSVCRVVLSAFPAFLEAAELCAKRIFFGVVIIVSALAQLVFLNAYSHWHFVG